MNMSLIECEKSLSNSEEEIFENSYVDEKLSCISLEKGMFNMITPKKQMLVNRNFDSAMIVDIFSPPKEKIVFPVFTNRNILSVCAKTDSDHQNDSYMDVIEIIDDTELIDEQNNQPITCLSDNCLSLDTNKSTNQFVTADVGVLEPLKCPATKSSSINLKKILENLSYKIFKEKCKNNLLPETLGIEYSLSFLSSLSDRTYGLKCHPAAVFYKKHFEKTKESLARHLFYIYNENVFNNKLPVDMTIKWSKKLTFSSGITTTKFEFDTESKNKRFVAYITLSRKIITTAERLRDTVLHEMCHAAVWLINNSSDSHGPIWKLWVLKAKQSLPELPPVKRCHSYETDYKYLYKCNDCGYNIGRSRPSEKLLTGCVCGYCGGRFRLVINTNDSTNN